MLEPDPAAPFREGSEQLEELRLHLGPRHTLAPRLLCPFPWNLLPGLSAWGGTDALSALLRDTLGTG